MIGYRRASPALICKFIKIITPGCLTGRSDHAGTVSYSPPSTSTKPFQISSWKLLAFTGSVVALVPSQISLPYHVIEPPFCSFPPPVKFLSRHRFQITSQNPKPRRGGLVDWPLCIIVAHDSYHIIPGGLEASGGCLICAASIYYCI